MDCFNYHGDRDVVFGTVFIGHPFLQGDSYRYGNAMALGYGVTAKNHVITIGLATTTFGGTLAVLSAAVAPLIQMPIMFFYLSQSRRIKRFLNTKKKESRFQL